MTALTLSGGSVLVGDRFLRADVNIENGVITDIGEVPDSKGDVVDCSERYIVPGLIDLQAIGGGLRTFSSNIDEASYQIIARVHAASGTTALCPTVISGPPEEMLSAVALAADLCEQDIDAGAAFVGVHVEGPFLSESQRGRHQAEHLREPSVEFAEELVDAGRGWVRMVTLAPELEGALSVIRYFTEVGVHVSAGHTNADANALWAAMGQGLSGVTQLFNCMPPLDGSGPGPVGIALSSDLHAGVVGDLVHVARDTLAALLKSRPTSHTYLTTASAPSLGSEKETFEVGGEGYVVRDGACFTNDGQLAGSALPLSRMVRNLIRELEIPVQTAVGMATSVPAQLLGLRERGRIRPGAIADVLVIQRHRVDTVILRGALLENFPNYQRLW
jgi:N-acetylglucosamine-6-phosphate deacetylase